MPRFEFDYTPSHAREFVCRAQRAEFWPGLYLCVGVANLGFAVLDCYRYGPPRGVTPFLIGVFLLAWPHLERWFAAHWTKKHPPAAPKLAVTVGASGLHTESASGSIQVPWSRFVRARTFPDGVLLLRHRRAGFWLPFSSLTAGRREDVTGLLEANVKNYRALA